MTGKKLSATAQAERERIGATLRRFRELRGMKPDELATNVGISRSYLANIEAGRKPLTQVNLARVADALGIEQIELVRAGFYDEAAA